ncbi:ornithine cyclodeaminase family protein [Limosilactobacillus fermentum]|uniref:ornithine cyclodeaminase family protein n=1 Tax=Limosilactobacillus fermentum TaxID=1613 RepID=UPI003EBAC31E
MTQVTMLSASQISHLLDMPSVIDAVADAYKEKANHPATLWPMVYEQLGGEADMNIRSGVLASKHVFGNKLLAWFGENAKRGLPELNGLVNLYNSDTGEPVAVLNATALTGFRTGAVASRFLANPNATTLLLVGTGSQAPYQIMAQLCVLPKVTQVPLANPRDAKKAQAAAAQLPMTLEKLFSQTIRATNSATNSVVAGLIDHRLSEVEFTGVTDLPAAVQRSRVIVTATPSTKPLIQADWVQPGTHLNAIGADMEGKQELDAKLFQGAQAYTDDVPQASEVGEIQNPIKAGVIKPEQVVEIGNSLLDPTLGRHDANAITIFDSTGIALQDLAAANLVFVRAKEQGVGTQVDL